MDTKMYISTYECNYAFLVYENKKENHFYAITKAIPLQVKKIYA